MGEMEMIFKDGSGIHFGQDVTTKYKRLMP